MSAHSQDNIQPTGEIALTFEGFTQGLDIDNRFNITSSPLPKEMNDTIDGLFPDSSFIGSPKKSLNQQAVSAIAQELVGSFAGSGINSDNDEENDASAAAPSLNASFLNQTTESIIGVGREIKLSLLHQGTRLDEDISPHIDSLSTDGEQFKVFLFSLLVKVSEIDTDGQIDEMRAEAKKRYLKFATSVLDTILLIQDKTTLKKFETFVTKAVPHIDSGCLTTANAILALNIEKANIETTLDAQKINKLMKCNEASDEE